MPSFLSQRLTDLTSTLAEACNGSPEALAALYKCYSDSVRRVAYRLTGSEDEAEDVVQDVFVGLPEALGHYEERGSFDAWLGKVATRVALMRLRRSRRETGFERAADRAAQSEVDAVAARLTLHAALAALPEELRVVFVLKEMEGYSHAEVADFLDIRIGTSEVRLHRAVRRLRELLENTL